MERQAEQKAASTTDTVVIGAGHAGLAASYFLSELAVDHVVLERGEIANSWRNERWDSLTLLTPNWQSRLPGYSYSGPDPDGFMTVPELIDFIESYAGLVQAPVRTATTVTGVTEASGGYTVLTNRGDWRCRCVIIASGACNVPAVPRVADALPDNVVSVTPHDYRNPDDLAEGGVLVVGASATGLQLAEEIHQSGRPVTIAAGEHVRLPRIYRGRDIQWWMDAAGILDEGLEDIDDINRARRLPSPQLVGSTDRQILDLNAMTDQGMGLVGRLMGVNGALAQFSGSLPNVCQLADLKMHRLLDTIDEWAETSPDADTFEPPERFARTRVDEDPRLVIDLDAAGISTVFWATGFRPDYSWLNVPVLDRKGWISHEAGVGAAAGLYVLGMPFLRRRKSSFIHGIEDDARYVTSHLASYLKSLAA